MRRPSLPSVLVLLLAALASGPALAQHVHSPLPSGGPLDPEQAAIDVTYIELDLRVDPAARTLGGRATTHARIVHPTHVVVFDLDDPLAVTSATATLTDHHGARHAAPRGAFERLPGRLRVPLGRTAQPGETVVVSVDYGGQPHVATRPPWDGGITWAETPGGQPWVAMSVQGYGADMWWPAKDHPSDEPDSLRIALTVPASLRAIANGRHEGRTAHGDGWATERWFVSQPINNYGVSFGVGPYVAIRRDYVGPTGTTMPVTLWALPERAADMERQTDGFLDAMAFLERTFGPYPWRADGYQVLHTPYLGMEHQSLIAYGSTFQDNAYGFDWLHFHELVHEWWANLATAPDWRDFWVHESFATYAEALYAEDLARRRGDPDPGGVYRRYLGTARANVRHVLPLAPRESRTTLDMYALPDGGFNGDIYYKGALVLNTLRWLIADDAAFVGAMRGLLYPTPADAATTDGRQARWVGSADVIAAFERAAGRDLAGVFEVYLRQPALPRLDATRTGDRLALRWIVPEAAVGAVFDVPLEVDIDGRRVRVPMPGGAGEVDVPSGARVAINPDEHVLFDRTGLE